jgi:L-ascorbate peroxidase
VINLLTKLREEFSQVSWADMIAVGGAAAVEKTKGPIIKVGLGRVDATEVAPEHRLPRIDQDAPSLKDRFHNMSFTMQEVVVLAGAHTLGKAGGLPFTRDLYEFTNTFYQQLLKEPEADLASLPTDKMLVEDEESRGFVELYAANQELFYQDFAKAYHKTTWLGQTI